MKAHSVANFILNGQIVGISSKFTSHQKPKVLEMDPIFDSFQNAIRRLSEPKSQYTYIVTQA